eukprot:TRINITY_DN93601_c0_g1_i1.p1 TRINITY_DN93601_c0_g1~~TRINITY_DN93601_c0_g1_i1.p1  ORF type:complete len:361 (-),score=28.59 TRINITY_DN93601_c0_g1_i1:193-1275(-)
MQRTKTPDHGWMSDIVAPRSKLPDHSVEWARVPIDPKVVSKLHARSDVKGFVQSAGWLSILLGLGALALWSWGNLPWPLTALFVFMYGMVANFSINAVHELGHGMVFRTKILSIIFLRIIAFFGWLHPDMFFASHLRHHRYTLHFPYDQEVVLPVRLTLTEFLIFGFINIKGFCEIFQQTLYAAINHFPTGHLWWAPEWEAICYPADQPELRKPAQRWAQVVLFGHLAITLVSLLTGYWLVPVIFCLGPFYGGWLFFLCNTTQHVGLHPKATDFRLCCRTFYLNPVVRFLYWHMNWHIEHHMYAAVPCYNLAALHEEMKPYMPPAPNGIIAVWKQIIPIIKKQRANPNFLADVALPPNSS